MANKNIGKNKKGLDAVSDASKVKKIKTKVQKEELIDDEREDNISSSKKDKVLKKGKNKEKNDGYEIISEDSFDMRVLHILRTAIVILVIFLVFYFVTVLITGYSGKKSSKENKDTTISYSTTIVGRSFSMPEEEYLILYYDNSDEELNDFVSLVSTYRSSEENYTIYTVDMGDSLNKNYVADSSNTTPSSVSEISINGPTLIHFSGHQVVEYIEGKEAITDYLQ